MPLDLTAGVQLTHLCLTTVWGARNVTEPTLKSVPQTGLLSNLVVVFLVGAVEDEIMRSVIAALEDLKHKCAHCITFTFRRLGNTAIPKHGLNIIPLVVSKMAEYFGDDVVVKAKWLGLK